MKITVKDIYINQKTIECCLWHIQRGLMEKYGMNQSERDMEPLKWYISTGRASVLFIDKLINSKPFMVGRKLHHGGSTEEVIDRVCEYIGYERSV